MTKKNFIHKKDIFLFRPPSHGNHLCQLKNFIHFLHMNGVQRPFKFSYVEAFGPLLGNLTLKENILLESIQNSLSETKEIQLSKLLNQTKNEFLIRFFQQLESKEFLEKTPDEVTQRVRKIAALIKGLLHGNDFLFLESPETFLTPEDLDLFIRALKYQTEHLQQVVLISSPNEKEWFNHVSKLVTRGPSQEFLVSPILGHKLKEKYLKKKSKSTEKSTVLKFHHLQTDEKESA